MSENVGVLTALRIDASNGPPAAVAISRPPCVKVAGTPHPLVPIVCIVAKTRKIALSDQQFPLVGTIAPARAPISSVVPSQADFWFRSPTFNARIGSLHKLGHGKTVHPNATSFGNRCQGLGTQNLLVTFQQGLLQRLSPEYRSHIAQEESQVSTGRGLSYP